MTKSRRGDCGSCHWFELDPTQQNGNRVGYCMVNPPVAAQGMQQNPITNQVRPILQGIRPPVSEHDRCEKWRQAGVLPVAALLEKIDAAE